MPWAKDQPLNVYKFLVSAENPVIVGTVVYHSISAVVVASSAGEAKTTLKNYIAIQCLPDEWVDFVEPVLVSASIPSVAALTWLG